MVWSNGQRQINFASPAEIGQERSFISWSDITVSVMMSCIALADTIAEGVARPVDSPSCGSVGMGERAVVTIFHCNDIEGFASLRQASAAVYVERRPASHEEELTGPPEGANVRRWGVA